MRDLENKLLFSDPKNKRALLSLISATLGLKVKEATVIDGKTIRSKERASIDNEKDIALSFTEVDVLAILPDKSKVIIEFQMAYQKFWGKRALLYAVNRFAQQLEFLTDEKTSTYQNIYPVYIVSILDHNFFRTYKGLMSVFRVLEENRLEPLLDEFGKEMLKLIFVELPKYDQADESVSQLLKDWCQYFNNEELSEETDQDVKFAKRILESYQHNKEVQQMIETARLRDIANRDVGREEGKREGKKEGKKEVAIKLLESGFSMKQITRLTGLSIASLQELARKHNITGKNIT